MINHVLLASSAVVIADKHISQGSREIERAWIDFPSSFAAVSSVAAHENARISQQQSRSTDISTGLDIWPMLTRGKSKPNTFRGAE